MGPVRYYRPATVNFNDLSSGSLIVEFNSSAPGSAGLPLDDAGVSVVNTFVEGYWELTRANSLNSSDYNIDLTGNGFTTFPINDATRIVSRASSGSDWTTSGTHVAALGNVPLETMWICSQLSLHLPTPPIVLYLSHQTLPGLYLFVPGPPVVHIRSPIHLVLPTHGQSQEDGPGGAPRGLLEQRFGNDVAHLLAGVQAGERILKDHLHSGAHRQHLAVAPG